MNTPSMIRVGTAGWSIPKEVAAAFPAKDSHLERYARVFTGVEINSTFYRPHRVATYERWAASVPDKFRFAVKVPKTITHDSRLSGTEDLLNRFLVEVGGPGRKLGPLLVQLPPSLSFAAGTSARFLQDPRARVEGPIACEHRHRSWFTLDVDALLDELRIGRVAADPAPMPGASAPGGWRGLTYYRLHGSTRIYHSSYGSKAIQDVVDQLYRRARERSDGWCIFDNTAVFAATPDALAAQKAAVVLTSGQDGSS